MPRFKYWVIVMDAVPTAFRAGDAAELLPTLRQLQRRHPQSTMKWFERGRYWESPEDAYAALRARREKGRSHDRPRGAVSAKGGPRRSGPRKPGRRH